MKLLTFAVPGVAAYRVGVEVKDRILDLNTVFSLPNLTMKEFLMMGEEGRRVASAIKIDGSNSHAKSAIVYKAPIYNPEKLLCIGMNYVDHCTEQGVPIPKEPIVFSKFASSIIATGEPVVHPAVTKELDFEVEMVIVVGKSGKNIPTSKAMEHVLGYTVAHDVSARDWQLKRNGGQWLLGKTCDTFAPIGPVIVTKDELKDPHNLPIRCYLNGETVQDSSTKHLVFKTEFLINWISKLVTLTPGDLIFTGTPPGVGCFRKPKLFLKPGDVVTCEVEGIGSITNPIVAEVLPSNL